MKVALYIIDNVCPRKSNYKTQIKTPEFGLFPNKTCILCQATRNESGGRNRSYRRNNEKGFWKTGRPLQNLRYESIAVPMPGKTGALVTGKFVLSSVGDNPERTDWFTSVWQKTKNGWRMIRDHS